MVLSGGGGGVVWRAADSAVVCGLFAFIFFASLLVVIGLLLFDLDADINDMLSFLLLLFFLLLTKYTIPPIIARSITTTTTAMIGVVTELPLPFPELFADASLPLPPLIVVAVGSVLSVPVIVELKVDLEEIEAFEEANDTFRG